MAASTRPVELREAAARVAVYALVLTAALVPLEAGHYLGRAGFPPDASMRAAAVVVLAGATLALMTPGVLVTLLVAGIRPVAARRFGSAWASLAAVWVVLDVLVQKQTGNRGSYYLKFVFQPDALRWAGNVEGLAALFAREGTYLLLYLVVALVGAAAAARWIAPTASTRDRWLALLAVAWLGTLAAGPALERASAAPRGFLRLNDAMSFPWNVGFRTSTDLLATTEQRAAEIYRRHYGRLGPLPVVPADVPDAPPSRPNVVVIVVDGLRRDMLSETVMPRLLRWSDRGARFGAHFAAANGSEWGSFGLLYGLTPFAFPRIAASGVPPTLLSVLWRWGYETHFVTSGADVGWLMVGRFLGPSFFAVHAQPPERPGWENDRACIDTVRDLLAAGGPPKFIFVWLAATHWEYSWPASYWPFTPDVIVPKAADAGRRGWQRVWIRFYTRAARYVDDLLGEWLETLDLAHNLVVVTADHGEGFYDDGSLGHGSRLSSAEVEVPLVVAGPGVPRQTVIDRPTGNLDVAPTLLDLLGDPGDAEQAMFGQPLLPADRERPLYEVVYRPVDEPALQLRNIMALSASETTREVLLVSNEARFGIRIDPAQPAVSRFGLMDENGAVTEEAISPDEAETFLTWFEDTLSRSERIQAPSLARGASRR